MGNIEISEFWKYCGAVALSCLISFGGFYISNSSNFATKQDVETIINAKMLVFENEMKHYDATMKDLKGVINNNNLALQDFSKQLVKFEVLLDSLSKNQQKHATNAP